MMAETEKLKENLQALVKRVDVGVDLDILDNPLGISASTGVGRKKPVGGGGIESPLTENDYSQREYWTTNQVLRSQDGLFSIEWNPIKKIIMTDDSGNDVEFIYAEPTP